MIDLTAHYNEQAVLNQLTMKPWNLSIDFDLTEEMLQIKRQCQGVKAAYEKARIEGNRGGVRNLQYELETLQEKKECLQELQRIKSESERLLSAREQAIIEGHDALDYENDLDTLQEELETALEYYNALD